MKKKINQSSAVSTSKLQGLSSYIRIIITSKILHEMLLLIRFKTGTDVGHVWTIALHSQSSIHALILMQV